MGFRRENGFYIRLLSMFLCLFFVFCFVGEKCFASVPRYNPNKTQKPGLYRTGNMHYPRINHQATLLHDGRVLVTGGRVWNNPKSEDTSEIYDPKTGKFTDGPKMNYKHHKHEAILLPDGRVFITGKYEGIEDESRHTEFYNPKTNKFEKGPDSLFYHSAEIGAGFSLYLYPNGDIYLWDSLVPEFYSTKENKFYSPYKAVTSEYSDILYIKTKELNKDVKWPYKDLHPFAVLDNNNLIYKKDNILYEYDFKTDKSSVFNGIQNTKNKVNIVATNITINNKFYVICSPVEYYHDYNIGKVVNIKTNMYCRGDVPKTALNNENILLVIYTKNWYAPIYMFDTKTNTYKNTNHFTRVQGGEMTSLKDKNEVLFTGGSYPWGIDPNWELDVKPPTEWDMTNRIYSKYAYIYIY